MKRLIENTVPRGFWIAWRRAICPTRRCPSWVNATTEGVVRPPSSFGITFGSLPSITATTEFVVPRSIPMTLPMRCSPALPESPCFRGLVDSCRVLCCCLRPGVPARALQPPERAGARLQTRRKRRFSAGFSRLWAEADATLGTRQGLSSSGGAARSRSGAVERGRRARVELDFQALLRQGAAPEGAPQHFHAQLLRAAVGRKERPRRALAAHLERARHILAVQETTERIEDNPFAARKA